MLSNNTSTKRTGLSVEIVKVAVSTSFSLENWSATMQEKVGLTKLVNSKAASAFYRTQQLKDMFIFTSSR